MRENRDLYCLIGDPVAHSLSPVMHNRAFEQSNLSAVYTTMLVRSEELEGGISSLRKLNVSGFNVTMPLKERMVEFVDSIDETAKKVRAVNTVVARDGKFTGYNTDGVGAVEAIRDVMKDLKGKRALILGKGGAGRAVAFGLAGEGMNTSVLGRNEMSEEELGREIENSDLLCNCTPIGMSSETTPVPAILLRKDLVVFDAVYREGATVLIRDARRSGCETIDGIQMLVNQGASSFRLWTGIEPNRSAMLESVYRRIRENSERQERNIFFIGFSGTGKSSVGKRVAMKLGRDFVDTDEVISGDNGLSVKEIFEKYGEDQFRSMELKTIKSASERRRVVVATGGGSVLNFENVFRMKESGTVVLLTSDPSSIYARLKDGEYRPILAGPGAVVDHSRILEEMSARKPYYDLSADLKIVTDGKSLEKVTNEVLGKLRGHAR